MPMSNLKFGLLMAKSVMTVLNAYLELGKDRVYHLFYSLYIYLNDLENNILTLDCDAVDVYYTQLCLLLYAHHVMMLS